VATHLRRLGVDRHVVKRVLGHAERDVTATYDRYNLLVEARAALELWSKELVSGAAKAPLKQDTSEITAMAAEAVGDVAAETPSGIEKEPGEVPRPLSDPAKKADGNCRTFS
jgi:hypothetical protein